MIHKNRALYIFQYLWEYTDEEHPATTKEIIEYLASIGISTTRKTVAEDAAELQNSGFAADRTNISSVPDISSLPS